MGRVWGSKGAGVGRGSKGVDWRKQKVGSTMHSRN